MEVEGTTKSSLLIVVSLSPLSLFMLLLSFEFVLSSSLVIFVMLLFSLFSSEEEEEEEE